MNKSLVYKIVGAIISTFVFVFALLGFSGMFAQKSRSNKYADWMKNLNDTTALRDVNMPGSHDTMALYSIANLAGQCQSLSLKDQLNLGVRFLDIRLKRDNNQLKVVHGAIDQKAQFSDVTKVVKEFLTNHQQEFIVMSIKEEADPTNSNLSFEECLLKELEDSVFLKETTIPAKVGNVRGKVVLLSRYASSTIGIPAYDGWKDSASFVLPNNIYVQDTYKVSSAIEKESEITKCFNITGYALKINFLSAYLTSYFPPSYAVSSAKDVNPWINKEISKYSDRGIVLYDFINEDNMNHFFEGLF